MLGMIKSENKREPYGQELILDLHGCDASTFNRKSLDGYFETLCKAIKMQKCERYFWDGHDMNHMLVLPGIYVIHIRIAGEMGEKIQRHCCAVAYQ